MRREQEVGERGGWGVGHLLFGSHAPCLGWYQRLSPSLAKAFHLLCTERPIQRHMRVCAVEKCAAPYTTPLLIDSQKHSLFPLSLSSQFPFFFSFIVSKLPSPILKSISVLMWRLEPTNHSLSLSRYLSFYIFYVSHHTYDIKQ